MSRWRGVVVRCLIALVALVATSSMTAAEPRALAFSPELPGFPPFVLGRTVEFRFQGPDEPGHAPRWQVGQGASESIAPGAASPLDSKGQAFDAATDGEESTADELDPEPDDIPPEDHGPGWGCCRRFRGCFGPILAGRYRDVGHPLDRESWRNRPLSFGLFAGSLAADDLSSNRIVAGTAFFGGLRFGWDYSHFGGLETRLGWTKVALDYPQNPTIIGDGNFLLWDANWLYYPWGDTQWRPFFLVGLGMVDMKFIDDNGLRDHDTVFGLPLGIGLKYRWDARLAFRFEIIDNIAFAAGNGLDDMSHFSFTAGLECHFGGATQRSYWPWNPSRELW